MSLPPIDAELMKWLQAGAWLATAIAAVVAALKFWSELRLGRQQRERDLRWKQAEAAKALNDEMLEDAESKLALEMLDYTGRSFTFPSGRSAVVTPEDLRQALDPANTATVDTLADIRYCFDRLIYYFATLQHYIKSTLILPDDVA